MKNTDDTEKNSKKTKIIVSASGMCEGGKIIDLLKDYLPKDNVVVVLCGYQAKNTNGYKLKNMQNYSDIEKLVLKLELDDIDIRLSEVKCDIMDLSEFYTGHADQDMLFEYVAGNDKYTNNSQTKVFLNHGQKEHKQELKERLQTKENISVEIPEDLSWYNLNTGEKTQDEPLTFDSQNIADGKPTEKDYINVIQSLIEENKKLTDLLSSIIEENKKLTDLLIVKTG